MSLGKVISPAFPPRKALTGGSWRELRSHLVILLELAKCHYTESEIVEILQDEARAMIARPRATTYGFPVRGRK